MFDYALKAYEARTPQFLTVFGVRHASVLVFDTNMIPILRSIFYTLQCPCIRVRIVSGVDVGV